MRQTLSVTPRLTRCAVSRRQHPGLACERRSAVLDVSSPQSTRKAVPERAFPPEGTPTRDRSGTTAPFAVTIPRRSTLRRARSVSLPCPRSCSSPVVPRRHEYARGLERGPQVYPAGLSRFLSSRRTAPRYALLAVSSNARLWRSKKTRSVPCLCRCVIGIVALKNLCVAARASRTGWVRRSSASTIKSWLFDNQQIQTSHECSDREVTSQA
jgi:hypothetical protein